MDALIAMKAIPSLRSKWSWWNNTSRNKSSSAEAAVLNGWTKQATKKLKGKNFLRKMQWQRAAQGDKHLLLEASKVTVVQTTLTYLKVCQDHVTRNSFPDLLYPCLPLCSLKKMRRIPMTFLRLRVPHVEFAHKKIRSFPISFKLDELFQMRFLNVQGSNNGLSL